MGLVFWVTIVGDSLTSSLFLSQTIMAKGSAAGEQHGEARVELAMVMASWPASSSAVAWSQLTAKARLQLHGSGGNDDDGELASFELHSSTGELVCWAATGCGVAPTTASAGELACWMTTSGVVAHATTCEHLRWSTCIVVAWRRYANRRGSVVANESFF